jgi:transcription-repair coupling factor (superfamily II helicase)
VREALLREKNRGGPAFFLHNRVQSIEAFAARELRSSCPSAASRSATARWGRELEEVMDAFSRGDVDVLVATTIVENGLDIPAAGTILIDEADHFGLAELHQLRGRVGRGSHKPTATCSSIRTSRCAGRARAAEGAGGADHLGAGFAISMKDLEIRGAGPRAARRGQHPHEGAQQSGHIAAVGYDLYCRLLKQR